MVAVVERDLPNSVKDSAKAPRHWNVVRAYEMKKLAPADGRSEGVLTLALPDGLKREHASLIAYVQGGEGILQGAVELGFQSPSPNEPGCGDLEPFDVSQGRREVLAPAV